MRTLKITALAAALAFACSAQAQTFELQRSAGDLVPQTLSVAKAAAVGASEPQPLHFAWALEADAKLTPAEPYRADSREFWTLLDASQVKAGWGFTPTADGALVRISLQGASKAGALSSGDLQLRVDGEPREAAAVIQHQASDVELKATGAQFSEGTLVFQLADGLAGRRIEVALPKARGGALLHVLEPKSTLSMQLSADRVLAAAGSEIRLDAGFLDAGKALAADRIAGLITAPDGRSFDLEFSIDKTGRASARFVLPADAGGGLEPWEVHAFGATGKGRVLRDARTAVMVGVPSARLVGSVDVEQDKGALRFVLPVETAAAGRFEVRGTLFGTDADGQLRPMAIAHAADLLPAGQGRLELRFPADVRNPKLGAPYALRDLSLSDQTRLSLNEQRQEALRLAVLP
ncbi:DUF4785 domain-containing protein [Aquimonas voraii]|uniref:DUF4785 domain-containing protein n=1 Tax=Aquimonas voraii TaxID=265719 RepID=A0A1G6SS25_9GAMM|nr:DUF4785 domain-containing protein [Aquimonas voraii]SDD19740.1 hypothetical protein SAMN04488509_101666 [Aquimonas voraii]